jgi:hypothetical protein
MNKILSTLLLLSILGVTFCSFNHQKAFKKVEKSLATLFIAGDNGQELEVSCL